jgi:hypothetical protein
MSVKIPPTLLRLRCSRSVLLLLTGSHLIPLARATTRSS